MLTIIHANSNFSFVNTSCQDLKGKILLKAKKIGSLEDSFSGVVEDSQSGEVSDEDEVAEIDEDNHHHESIRRRVKVGQTVGCTPFIHFRTGVMWYNQLFS